MSNEREVSMDQLVSGMIAYNTAQGIDMTGITRETVSDFLDMTAFVETDRNDDYQNGTSDKTEVRGAGYYQLQTGPEDGGYTRLNRAKDRLPTVLTPSWMARHRDRADKNNKDYDVKRYLTKEGQDFLMASNILLKDHEALRKFSNAKTLSDRKEIFLEDFWLDDHWGGAGTYKRNGYPDPTTYRKAKKDDVRDRMDGVDFHHRQIGGSKKVAGYKRQKDWADIEDNVFNEFDINDYT